MKTKIEIIHYLKSEKVSIQIGDDPSCKIYDLDIDSKSLCLELLRFHDANKGYLRLGGLEIIVQNKEFYK